MTPSDIEAVAVRAAQAAVREMDHPSRESMQALVSEAVKQTLIQLGIDHQNPLEMQQDFQYLRTWRKSGQELKRKTTIALAGLFLSGFVALFLMGIKEWAKRP